MHSVVPEGLSISVAEMRSVVGRSARRPVLGRWQVVVIEDADRLTEQASNALLKAVEEPPPRTVFLLCVPSLHPDDVSLTIRSRCRLVTLRIPPPEAIAAVLQADGIDRPMTPRGPPRPRRATSGGRGGWPATTAAREHRATVLAIPSSLTSMAACLAAADHLVGAAEAEAAALSAELDATETEALQIALGARRHRQGHGRRRRAARPARCARISRSGRSRARPARSATPSTARWSTSPRSTATCCSCRRTRRSRRRTRTSTTTSAPLRCALDRRRCCSASTRCSPAAPQLELNVKPRIAVEALTAALRLPA